MNIRTPALTLLFASLSLAVAEPHARADDPPLYAPEDGMLEAGAFLGLFLPSSDHELYDPTLTREALSSPALDLGLRAAYFPVKFIGAELEGALIPASTEADASSTIWGLRAHLIGQYPGRLTPFVLLGGGGLFERSAMDANGNDSDSEFHWGIGAKYYLTHLIGLRVDGRHYLTSGYDPDGGESATGHFELLAGVTFTFLRAPEVDPDPDKDTFSGSADKCPNEKGVAPDGCPVRDRDEDGVPDKADKCPEDAGTEPDGCNPKDSDLDTLPDKADKCPEEAGIAPDGCPDPDPDKDSVPRDRDRCPDVAGIEPDGCPDPDPDKDTVAADADRCPDVAGVPPDGCPDQDADGLADDKDGCPDKPETKNAFQDGDGCPDELPKELAKFTGSIKGITFTSGKAEITAASFKVLDEAAAVLTQFGDLRMEIQGHTDNSGEAEKNKVLSQARADAVKVYLMSKGIAEARLTAIGYGPDVPVGDNNTAEGKAKNRRIEFKLIQ